MNEEPFGCLLRLLWLPYHIGKAIAEQSIVGTSEMDRAAGRFWRNVAIIGTLLLLLGLVVWIYVALN